MAQPVQVAIRRMQSADVDAVMEIASSLHEAPHWPRQPYLAAIAEDSVPRRIALVAVEGTEDTYITGFAVASMLPPEAELESIAVAASAQRQGIATALMRALNKELKAAQITTVQLEVRSSNARAIRLYQSIGFRESGTRRAYYRDPVEDAMLLHIDLNPGHAKPISP